ncbi:MAG: response regulator [Magnetococcales bacterium]|nr:response regulator [Magnetococcales bacterium]MBF0114636.1 response regulator [Magnetococcales bacterium]
MAEEDEELLAMFVQESTEHLENIEPNLLILEERGAATDPEIINSLFRGVHSIKGSAGFFGLTAISKLSHTMENLLGKVRDKSIEPTSEVSDSLLSALDKLKTMVHDVINSEAVDASAEVAAILAILERSGHAVPSSPAPKAAAPAVEAAPAPVAPAAEATPEAAPAEAASSTAVATTNNDPFVLDNYTSAVSDALKENRKFYDVRLEVALDDEKERKDFVNQFSQLVESVGTVVDFKPALGSGGSVPTLPDKTLRLLVSSVLTADLLQDIVQLKPQAIQLLAIPTALVNKLAPPVPVSKAAVPEVVEAEPVRAVAKPKSSSYSARLLKPRADAGGAGTAGRTEEKAKAGQPTVEETLRVSVALLDELINMAGELVLTRNQLIRATSSFVAQSPHLASLVQSIDSVTSRIHGKVMQARMQPVNVVFNKFPRIVRDLALKLGKKIDLEVRGGDVELDKSVIEHLSDPLTHMIRNVADHAIELPKDRVGIGKPEAGKVELAAYHENGMVNIALIDDGAGIDSERIKTKAIEKGLITESRAAEMSEEELLDLIFAPGFSMAKKVSDVSGRGVGMDVVRTNIEKLRGTVHIASKVGKGTRIILKLPLTLAIIPAMIVSAGKLRFAIPEIGLIEIVRVAETDLAKQIQMVCDAPVLSLRHTLLPLVDLASTLGIETPDGDGGIRWMDVWSRQHSQEQKNNSANNGNQPAPKRTSRPPGHSISHYSQAIYVMVINVSGNTFGLVVDDVLDSEEIVVKPLPSYAKDTTCFSAVTILGDGSVASIIDYAGIVEKAKINFSSLEAASADMEEVTRAALREKQNIILLETPSGLVMGIVNNMVSRVEVIQRGNCRMENINHQSYMHYNGVSFHILYPDHILGLEGNGYSGESNSDEDTFCMVVPAISGLQVGLMFSRIVDTMEAYIDLDTHVIQADGLFGTARIDGRLVLFPDLNRLFQLADIMPHSVETPVDYDGLKALVVDDTPFLRIVTTTYLTQAGFMVEQAEDGMIASQRLKNTPYDLVVTDINMPVMDGLELAKEIPSTLNADTPIIATTSFISSDLVTRCVRSGMVGCVPSTDKFRLLNMLATLKRV